MKVVDRIEQKLEHDLSFRTILKIVLVMCAIWLVKETSSFWLVCLQYIWKICAPFVIGFMIAYVLRGPIAFGEKHGIKRGVMILLVYAGILVFLLWLVSSIVPLLLSRTSDFVDSLIQNVNWLYELLKNYSSRELPNWITVGTKEINTYLRNFGSFLPNLASSLPDFLGQAVKIFTTGLFACIISIFISFAWENTREWILGTIRHLSGFLFEASSSINEALSSYIHSVLILMLIRLVEYALLYIVVGNEDWMVLALLTSVALLIPYIGPTIINCIGILTTLNMPNGHPILLIIFILIMSNVDGYVIAPIVHSKNTAVSPLAALFSIFAGGTLCGTVGMIFAIPAYLSFRIIYQKYRMERWRTDEA